MTSRSKSAIASTRPSDGERELRKQLNRANRRLATIERRRREAREFRPVMRLLNELAKIGQRNLGE